MATGANATPLDFPNKKRKRSRWNQDTMEQKTVIPGMPTVIPPGLTREQERAYIVQLQIEDLTRKLRTGDLGIPPNPEDRLGNSFNQLTVTLLPFSQYILLVATYCVSSIKS
uniref:Splicing factor 1 n=1 Tax=Molossus molossus TaxID=27622 RepID=A0A7J8EUC4_MOLMO|nr:splicing factor 1 [Molossus molossus]